MIGFICGFMLAIALVLSFAAVIVAGRGDDDD